MAIFTNTPISAIDKRDLIGYYKSFYEINITGEVLSGALILGSRFYIVPK
ncbi:MAG: hypothetical protein HY964_01255 [Ignavibacteriales bacterium]|nr:hypothetical protein [Ignavibacteriales bacterium]